MEKQEPKEGGWYGAATKKALEHIDRQQMEFYKSLHMDRKENFNVSMVTPEGKQATRTYAYQIEGMAPLGREIRISPKANVTVNKAGFKTEFFVPTVNVLIGIGKDNTADLIMTVDAWEALKSGEEISITTVKEFREKFA
jgi:hypothetical protein